MTNHERLDQEEVQKMQKLKDTLIGHYEATGSLVPEHIKDMDVHQQVQISQQESTKNR